MKTVEKSTLIESLKGHITLGIADEDGKIEGFFKHPKKARKMNKKLRRKYPYFGFEVVYIKYI